MNVNYVPTIQGCFCQWKSYFKSTMYWTSFVTVLHAQKSQHIISSRNDITFSWIYYAVPYWEMRCPISHKSENFCNHLDHEKRRMAMENCSLLPEFFLLGISSNPDMKGVLFLVFLVVYLVVLLSNVGIIILIRMDSQLHTPMYFFLSHLTFSDLSYSICLHLKGI